MSKVVKKSIPWFLIISLILTTVLTFNFMSSKVEADSADTSVTVGNTVPVFDGGFEPYEDAASATSTPTNVGNDVTFKATATDDNGDDWKLLICSSDSVSGLSCVADTFCTSDFASSTVQATCSYTALVGDTETEDWYGFACDATGCSAEDHKTDADIGPPFHVNHSPAFTVFADDGPKDPNTTITWSTTASDPDSGGSDTVSLYVCKTASFTGSACGDETWCSDTAKASNPTCGVTTPRPDGVYEAYGYVVDNHSFVSVDSAQGDDSSPEVNNSSPSITNSSINLLDTDSSGNLTLTGEETETTGFIVTFIVNDENSCMTTSSADEITSAFINVRMSEKATGACDITGEYNPNDCYPDDYASWNPVCAASSTVDACNDNTDTSVGWACTFPLQYHADPTIDGTPKALNNWLAAAQAEDDDAANSGLIDGTGTNEMDTFMGYNLTTAAIAYGTVAPDANSLEQTTIIEATGNVGLDETLFGTKLCDDHPTCAGDDDIAIAEQVYNLSQGLGWGSGTALVADPGIEVEMDCIKTTDTVSPASASTYWYLHVPLGQAVDSYTGSNTIVGQVDDENY